MKIYELWFLPTPEGKELGWKKELVDSCHEHDPDKVAKFAKWEQDIKYREKGKWEFYYHKIIEREVPGPGRQI